MITTNPATDENFDFGVWITYTANAATNAPPPGTATVNLSFAPNTNSGAFIGDLRSRSLERADDATVCGYVDREQPSLPLCQCTTSLLFPFITNQAGFDTGIAIMNTTSDPFGTKPQSGTCTLNFYGQNAPAAFVTAVIPSGNSWTPAVGAFMASTIAPNFEGYMIAVCNFQLAHGYAFVSDLGAQKLAHGYLALVLTSGTSSRPAANPESLMN